MVHVDAQSLARLTRLASDAHAGPKGPLAGPIRTDRAAAYAAALDAVLAAAAIETPLRLAHFIAQLAHETGGFRSLVESTHYSAEGLLKTFPRQVKDAAQAARLAAAGPVAIANLVYADRLGNGGPETNDGWNYRGRGFIMITGRGHYYDTAKTSALPVLDQPELMGEATTAAQAAGRYWTACGINSCADEDDCDGCTWLVNGGMNGAAERRAWLALAKQVWPAAG